MSEYKKKHMNDLNLGRRIRQLAVVLPAAATLTTACQKGQSARSDVERVCFWTQDSVWGDDYYGNPVTLKHVQINVYDNLDKEPTNVHLSRWGTPKEEMPEIYRGEDTRIKEVFVSEDGDKLGIEVFQNQYGIWVSKDQPCFIVDTNDQLVYMGDENTYAHNIKRYARANKLISQEKEETVIRDNRSYTVRIIPARPIAENVEEIPADTLENKNDSVAADVNLDSIAKPINNDTIVVAPVAIDSVTLKNIRE